MIALEKRREKSRRWFRRHKSQQRRIVSERREKIKQWYREYKSTLKCSRCPETDPVCLDFHHRNRSEKEIAVSVSVVRGWSIARILKEIAKCDVVCKNCHAKLEAGYEHPKETIGY